MRAVTARPTARSKRARWLLGRSLADLPGGPLQLGLGLAYRYEAINAPSGSPDTNGPTDRHFVLNAFGVEGSRSVYSAFGELNAPIVDQFTLNASARYVNVLNVLDDLPPIDPVTYGANLYNPVQGGTGIYGRMFRAGFKVGL